MAASGRARRHAAIAARLRRACSATIATACSRAPPVTGWSADCRITFHRGARSRAQREAVRQLPLLAPARNGVTRRSVGRIADVGAPVAGHAGPKSREALAAALADARDYTRRCYAHLAGGDPVFPCIAIVNPARWELGHIGWFQEFWCRRWRPDDRAGARTPARIANADALWNSSRVPHDSRWALPLPDWAGIDRYLGETYADTMASLATSGDGERYPYELSLYHEDMHGEALLMTLQTLGYAPPDGFPPPAGVGRAAPVRDIAFVGGALGMGSTPDDERERFVFDNEKLRHRVDVGAFAIASRTVTEDEFAAFVDDGGYRRSDLWSEDGRRWLAVAGRTVPAYWRPCASGYEVRWFDRWRPLSPGTAIQHVNAYEAEAWCAACPPRRSGNSRRPGPARRSGRGSTPARPGRAPRRRAAARPHTCWATSGSGLRRRSARTRASPPTGTPIIRRPGSAIIA